MQVKLGVRVCESVAAVWDSWPVFVARHSIRDAWRAQPGPWPVRVVFLALWGLAVLEPGPVGELVMLGVTAVYRLAERVIGRVWRSWRAGRVEAMEVTQ